MQARYHKAVARLAKWDKLVNAAVVKADRRVADYKEGPTAELLVQRDAARFRRDRDKKGQRQAQVGLTAVSHQAREILEKVKQAETAIADCQDTGPAMFKGVSDTPNVRWQQEMGLLYSRLGVLIGECPPDIPLKETND